jgi:pentatricopeptide repeat protein
MLITGYAQRNNIDAATSMLETMALRGVVPTVVSYNALISCLCAAGRASQTHNVVAMAGRRGIQVDEWAWSAIIQVSASFALL